jgi:ABC-type xylose transport system permease subunit
MRIPCHVVDLTARIPFALISWLLIPRIPSKLHANRTAKWKLLDVPGSLLILAALMLLNVGLTLGASRGWVNARFLVPTILSLPLAIAFFVWEYRVGEEKALIPVSLWKINNVSLMSWVALGLFPYMAVSHPPGRFRTT